MPRTRQNQLLIPENDHQQPSTISSIYTDKSFFCFEHRAYVNEFIKKKSIDKQAAKDLFRKVKRHEKANDPNAQFPEFLSKVNKGLESVDLALRFGNDDWTGEERIVLVNTVGSTPLSLLSSPYAPNVISFFRSILESLLNPGSIQSRWNSISSTEAINLLSEHPGALKKTERERALETFVNDGWLLETEYGLTIRTLLELDNHLISLVPETHTCHLCNGPIFQLFDFCLEEECVTMIHAKCGMGRQRKCPVCDGKWKVRGKSAQLASAAESSSQNGRQSRVPFSQQSSFTAAKPFPKNPTGNSQNRHQDDSEVDELDDDMVTDMNSSGNSQLKNSSKRGALIIEEDSSDQESSS